MKKGMAKAVAFCMTAGLTFSTASMGVMADTDVAGTTGFAQCSEYVNVRASGDTEGAIVGRLSNNDAVQIESVDENGWYKIRSGNVEGYVAGQYIATGSDADAIAEKTGYTTLDIGADVLNVRMDKSTDSGIVATVTPSDSIEVVQNDGDWLKVCLDSDTYGWVSADYVATKTEYATGETVVEAQAADAAAAYDSYTDDSSDSSYDSYSDGSDASYDSCSDGSDASYDSYSDGSSDASYDSYTDGSDVSYDSYSDGSSDVTYSDTSTASSSSSDALYQAYLTAQEAAMHPTSAEEAQSTAQAAIDAYNAYLQSLGVSTDSSASYDSYSDGSDASYADSSSETTYTDAGTADAASYDSGSSSAASTGSDVDSLYQAYLQAQEAAMHPTSAEEAQSTADAAVAAYNAYLNALGGGSASTGSETYTDSSVTSYETEAPQTEAPQTEAPQTEAPQTEAPTSTLGAQIAAYATQFVGNPYVYGGSSLTNGADCSGFTMAVFAQFGISLPHNAAAQSGCGYSVSLSDIQPGDLLFYDNGGGIGHVTIYIGGGQVCHASNERTGITISSLSYRNPVCAVRCWG